WISGAFSKPLGVSIITRRPHHGPRRRIFGGILFLFLRSDRAARDSSERLAATHARARYGLSAGHPGGGDAEPDGAEFFDSTANYARGPPAGSGAVVAAGLVFGAVPEARWGHRPGDANARQPCRDCSGGCGV